MRRLSVATVVAALGALVLAGGAQACSCAPTTPAEGMRQADAAIVGKLIEVVPQSGLRADFLYRVQHVYKRGRGIRRGRVISVRSTSQAAACGLPQRTGRRYGLLLGRGEGRWTGGLCGLVSPHMLDASYRRFSCTS